MLLESRAAYTPHVALSAGVNELPFGKAIVNGVIVRLVMMPSQEYYTYVYGIRVYITGPAHLRSY
jgi:hypothetical protein